jgi:hypothetical protein
LTGLHPHWPPVVVGNFQDAKDASGLLARLDPDAVKSMYGDLSNDLCVCDAHTMFNLYFASREGWCPEEEFWHVPHWRKPTAPLETWTSMAVCALDKEKPKELTAVHLQWTRKPNGVLQVALCQGVWFSFFFIRHQFLCDSVTLCDSFYSCVSLHSSLQTRMTCWPHLMSLRCKLRTPSCPCTFSTRRARRDYVAKL